MQLPLQSLYPQNDDAGQTMRGASSVLQQASGKRVAYLYTSGADIVGFQTRASVTDYLLRRTISGVGSFDDGTLADAYPASATALACTGYTARKTASIPLRILNSRRDPVEVSALSAFLLDAATLMKHLAFSLCIWGRFYARKRYNAAGYASGLEYINPSLVYELPGRDGYVEQYQIRDEVNGTIENVPAREIIYGQEFDSRPGGAGLSKYEAAWRYINVELGIVTYSAAYFVNNATPDGIITFEQDPDPETLLQIQQRFVQQFKGVENSNRLGFLPWNAKYIPMQTNPKDVSHGETDERVVKKICAVFGVNPALVSLDMAKDPLGANTTFNSMEVAFMRDVAIPMLEQVILPALNAQWAARDFIDPYIIEVDRAKVPEFTESFLSRSSTAGQAVNDGLLDYAEGRALLGYEPRDNDLTRDPAKPLALWNDGALTLDRFGQMVGYLDKPLGSGNGNVIKVNGVLIPLDRVREFADANVDKLVAETRLMQSGVLPNAQAPADSTAITVTPEPAPQLGAGDARAQDDTYTDTSLCIALDLANQPDLIAMQQAVRKYCEREGITAEWNAPDSLHITLAYAAQCTEEQAQAVIGRLSLLDIPELSLHVGSLSAFESVGSYPLHFRVRRNDDLLALQRACYDVMRECGLDLSAYSAPEAYKPHITVGYADTKVSWPYKGNLRVKPSACLVWHGDGEALYEKPCGGPVTLAAVTDSQTVRAVAPTALALRFGMEDAAPNVHLAQACRTLDEALRAAEQPNPEWVNATDYALVLCDMPNAAANAVGKLIRDLDLDGQRVIDLWAAGYALSDGDVYLTFEPSEELTALQSALALEVEALEFDHAMTVPAVKLCTLKQDIDPALLPERCERLPLVGVALSLYRAGQARHTWALAGESEARRSELKAYAKRMARSADKPFVFEALRNHPAAAWLNDARDAGVDLDDAMEVARAILAGEDVHYLRAYPQTRAGFVTAVTDLLGSANDGNMSRAKFGAQLRSLLRRYGLLAMRDGMNEVGYDPESLSQQEVAAFRAWQERQSAFVTGLGDELFKERKVNGSEPTPLSEPALLHRAQMWADVSLESARELGLYLAAPQEKFSWVMDPQAEHCTDCLLLNGKTYRMEEWLAADLTPTRGNTECKQGCRCVLRPNPSAKLSPLRLIGLTGSRRSEEDERDAEADDGGEPYTRHICDATEGHEHGDECGCETVRADERAEDCVSSKIAKLIDEGYEQDQAAAIAYSMCEARDWPEWMTPEQIDGVWRLFPDHVSINSSANQGEEEYDYRSAAPDDTADDDAYAADEQRAVPEKYSHIDFKPSEAMADNARRALEVREEKPASEKGMTAVGIARARDISNRKNLSPETVRRMKAYFDRHEVDKKGETWDEQGKGWQAWNGWGGDEGYAWSRKRVEQMNVADEKADA